MGCYVAPVVAAIVHYVLRKRVKPWRFDRHHRWLNLLFGGAAIFGFVDHLWNKELFLFSAADVLLGLTITAVVLVSWAGIVLLDRVSQKSVAKA
jgi:hypothetical protein